MRPLPEIWEVGPFDNDTAADFSGDLDQTPQGEREGISRNVLVRSIDTWVTSSVN